MSSPAASSTRLRTSRLRHRCTTISGTLARHLVPFLLASASRYVSNVTMGLNQNEMRVGTLERMK
jgi:hypothetical protein